MQSLSNKYLLVKGESGANREGGAGLFVCWAGREVSELAFKASR